MTHWAKLPDNYQLFKGRAVRLPSGQIADKPAVVPRMNKLELAYARHLDPLLRAGQVFWWEYEPMNLRLAPRTYYRPDFLVWYVALSAYGGGKLEFVEVKGFLRDRALMKFKVAAEKFPMFRFKMVRLVKGAWGVLYES